MTLDLRQLGLFAEQILERVKNDEPRRGPAPA